MVPLDTTYVEYDSPLEVQDMSKQKGEVQNTITIGTREATTVRGAQRILSERATKMGTPREYSRDTVYRMLIDNRIEAVRTPSANYYYVDQLDKVNLQPGRGKPSERKNYPQELKNQALTLRHQGLTQRAIAEKLGIRFQTIGYWLRANKQKS